MMHAFSTSLGFFVLGIGFFALLLTIGAWSPFFLIYMAFGVSVGSFSLFVFQNALMVMAGIGMATVIGLIIFFIFIFPHRVYIKKILAAACFVLNQFKFCLCNAVLLTMLINLAIAGFFIAVAPEKNARYYSFIVLYAFVFIWAMTATAYALQVYVSALVVHYIRDKRGSTSSDAAYSTRYAMGTIFFGALIIALVNALQSMADSAMENNAADIARGDRSAAAGVKMMLLCIFSCFAGIFGCIIEHINNLVFTYVAVNGTGYIESVKGAAAELYGAGMKGVASIGAIEYIADVFIISISTLYMIIAYLIFANDFVNYLPQYVLVWNFCVCFAMIAFPIVFLKILLSSISSAVLALIYVRVSFPEELDAYDSEIASAMDAKAAKMKKNV